MVMEDNENGKHFRNLRREDGCKPKRAWLHDFPSKPVTNNYQQVTAEFHPCLSIQWALEIGFTSSTYLVADTYLSSPSLRTTYSP
jgi:hypothetical protein